MKTLRKLIIGTFLVVVGLLLSKGQVFADEQSKTITLTYVSYDTTKLEITDMPEFNPMFDHEEHTPFNVTTPVTKTYSVQNGYSGISIQHIPNATAPHYSFNGWVRYVEIGGIDVEVVLRRGDIILEDTTFYARWTPIPKYLSYTLDGGVNDLGNPYMFTIKTTLELKPAYKNGYTFNGWYIGEDKITDYEKGGWWDKSVTPHELVSKGIENINIKPDWTINSYTISFNSNGGTEVSSITASFDEEITAPEEPTKEGHDFKGWYKEATFENLFTFNKMPYEDLTLYAKWEAIEYTISFVTNEGSSVPSIRQRFGTELKDLPVSPTKPGHKFNGWYIDNEFANPYSFPPTMPAKDTTVYAKWDVNSHLVSYVTNVDGEIITEHQQDYGTKINIPTIEKEGHELDGWYKEPEFTTKWDFSTKTMPDNDITLHAKWVKIHFTVEFLDYKDERLSLDPIPYGNLITTPADPNRDGYTFNGWKIDGTEDIINFTTYTVTSDVVFKPAYETITYTITYNLNGATGTNDNPISYTVESETITLNHNNLSKTGHEFKAYQDKDGNNITGIEKGSFGDKEISLIWQILNYDVSYVTNIDGVIIGTHTQTFNTIISDPNLTRAGYTLNGWYTDSNFITLWVFANNQMPAEDITLYASWTAHTNTNYTVIHYFQRASDLGYVEHSRETLFGTTDKPATINYLTHEGYTFNESHENNHLEDTIKGDGTTVLSVYYTINKYSVTFEDYNFSVLKAQDVYYNESATEPEDEPIRTGYTFNGWSRTFNNVKEILVIAATYTINEYTVTFNLDGGEGVESSTQNYDTLITKPADPTKEGYDFLDWYKEDTFINEWDFASDKVPANDITLYAKWGINVYRISFNSNGGTEVSSITASFDEEITAPEEPTKEGHDFKGWYEDEELTTEYPFPSTMPAENITLYAKWNINSYIVYFNTAGGSPTLQNQTVVYQELVASPEEVSLIGYVFGGWYSNETFNNLWDFSVDLMPASNLNLYAKWIPASGIKYVINYYQQNITDDLYTITSDSKEYTGITGEEITAEVLTYPGFKYLETNNNMGVVKADGSLEINLYYNREVYTVTFDADGGSPTPAEQYIKYLGSASTPTSPTRTGYTFTSWNRKLTYITENTTIKALWTLDNYDIIYHNVEEAINDNTKTYTVISGIINLIAATKDSHHFRGWYDNSAFEGDAITAIQSGRTGDIDLYAKWEIKTYTVTFKDGTTSLKEETVEHGSSATAPTNPTRTGYTFDGWDKAFDVITSDLTVTATYTINQYTITFVYNNGSDNTEITLDFGAAITPQDNPTKTGYIFSKWDPLIPTTMPVDGITVTALWTEDTFTISFNSNGGSLVNAISGKFGSTIIEPTPPNKTGYTFGGWYKEVSITNIWNFGADTIPAENITLYAKWNLIEYTITYEDTKSQTHLNPESYNIETATITLASLTHTISEIFMGWYDKETGGNQVISINTGSTGSKTLYARWETKTFKVNFDIDGGTPEPQEQTVAYGNKVTKPNNPSKTGHTFKYWKLAEVEWDFDMNTVTEQITLKAHYDINQYVVTFNSNEGSAVDSITQEYNTLITKPVDPTKAGYEFLSWYKEESLSTLWNFDIDKVPASPITLYAKWNALNSAYKVFHYQQNITGTDYNILTTFDLSGLTNSTVEPYKIEYVGFRVNETLSHSSGVVTADGLLELDVYYDREVYEVTFIYGLAGSITYKENVLYGAFATAPTEALVAVEGYKFAGWDVEFTNITSDLTVTATYTIKQYTITFNSNEGTDVDNITLDFGAEITSPADPTRTGYTFDGWYIDNEFDNPYSFPPTMPAENTDIYAKWEIINYTITYHNTKGASNTNQTTYNVESTFTLVNLSLETYDFVAWYDSDTGGSIVTEITVGQTGNINLYARWTARIYNITYQITHGIANPNPATYTVETGTITLDDLADRDSHTFAGWYTTEHTGGTHVQTIEDGSSGNRVLYARWEIKTYTVTFKDYNDYVLETQTVDHGSDATAPADPIREHYIFNAWNKSLTGITENTIITAQYNKQSYTVTFKDWNDSTIGAQSVLYLESATAPVDPTRTGYTFDGWDSDFTEITGNLIVKAQYTIITYTVTFQNHDGTVLKTQTVNHGSSATAPTNPTRTGYTFKEWSPNVFTNITTNMTVIATYTIINYTVSYTLNSGYLKYESKDSLVTHFISDFNNYFYGQNKLTKEDFVDRTYAYPNIDQFFVYVKKWEWMKTYIKKVAKDQDHSSLTNLIGNDNATWRFAIHHFINGTNGTSAAINVPNFTGAAATGYGYLFTNITSYNYGNTKNLDTPRRNGYVFLGWYANADFSGGKITKITSADTGNKTFYARWVSELVIATQYGGTDNTGQKIIVSTVRPNQYWYVIGVVNTPGNLLYQFQGKGTGYDGTKNYVIAYHDDVTDSSANTLKTIYAEIGPGYYVRIGNATPGATNINIRFYKH